MRTHLHGPLSLAVLVLGIVVAPAVEAQSAGPGAAPPAVASAKKRIELDHAALQPIEAKAAIAHVPFPIVDPQTKQPVPPAQIVVGPKGQRVSAQDYWGNVNKFEKYLNDRGLSQRTIGKVTKIEKLREDDALAKGRLAKMVAQRKPISPAMTQFQAACRIPTTPAEVTRHAAIAAAHKANAPPPGGSPDKAMNRNAVSEIPFSRSWPFGQTVGGNQFNVELGGSESVDSSMYRKGVSTIAHVNATVFGSAVSLVEVQVASKSAFSENTGGWARAAGSITMAGVDLQAPVDIYVPSKAELYADRKSLYSQTWGPAFPSVYIPIGPFGIDITVTQTAHAEVDGAYRIVYGSVRADLIPSTSLNVAISASLNLPGLELGVKGKLTVFDDKIDLSNLAELTDPGREAKVVVTQAGLEHADMLRGSLTAFANVGWWLASYEIDIEIYAAAGTVNDTALLDTHETIAIMPPPPPPPPPGPPLKAAVNPGALPPPSNQGSTKAMRR